MTCFQFSSLHLWTSMECEYCVANVLICVNVLLIFVIGSFKFAPKLFIDGMCVLALVLATNTMSGITFYPLVVMLLMSD